MGHKFFGASANNSEMIELKKKVGLNPTMFIKKVIDFAE